jgi:hypothetical protein
MKNYFVYIVLSLHFKNTIIQISCLRLKIFLSQLFSDSILKHTLFSLITALLCFFSNYQIF